MIRSSRHAQHRAAQRAIPEIVLSLLDHFGKRRRIAGKQVRYFDARTREALRHALREALGHWDSLGNAYVVVDARSEAVITVGHRHRRMRHR